MFVKRVMKKIGGVISILIFVFGLIAVFVVASTSAGKVPDFFGYSVLDIVTTSMEPAYKSGDLVVTEKTDGSDLKAGDVISFYSSDPQIAGIPNTHRIESVKEENGNLAFITKGDNNAQADLYPVSASQIIGQVRFKIPYAGKAITFLQNRIAFFFCLILPLLILIIFEIVNIVSIVRGGDEEHEKENQ